ncbi:MAG: TIGR03842 family LLM class F420-dependent oxidoreductase [bacterium]|nr:TIGR03842 family LLM class F420-dependent oxidoreductase [bacterium]
MQFGATFLTDPPPGRIVELARKAEDAGFDYVWLVDSQVLWQDSWIVAALIAEATERVKIGPMVTNPVTRDWSVIASMLGVLDEISGGRIVCGIGRGDSAVRTVGLKPSTVDELRHSIRVIKDLFAGNPVEHNGVEVKIEWADGRELEVWGAGYGPRVLNVVGGECDGFILQLTDPDIFEWILPLVRDGAAAAGRTEGSVKAMVAGPAYITGGNREHAHSQLRWFAGSVANHVSDLIAAHGVDNFPEALTTFMQGRPKYDYNRHGQIGNPSTEYVPNEINERFCVIGEPQEHIDKLQRLNDLGMDQYNIYFIHDAVEATMEGYGEHVIPAFR